MDKPPKEWIDKLFNCMAQFYGVKWTGIFDRWCTEAMLKTQWQSALTGLTYDEIKRTLVLLKQASRNPLAEPPNQLEFYSYAKGTSRPVIQSYQASERGDPDIARAALHDIKMKLRYKCATA